ncbi:DUF2252 domain-containing protein [Synechococcus elongatus]|uniref:DUF2252 domain-containing protein n=1 Tax=Synechococcus elongatus PCC 11801 TaxID=2219813 RepID=A0AAN1UV22_SYNEL|nr:DUF2252 domain-containing protein [Synechococcus elongatus]AZB73257.1 DUF2252 domain-containing protein [Synechococcus elongatus PCC 11801]
MPGKDKEDSLAVAQFHVRAERIAAGKTIRKKLPRADHADWKITNNRRDPIAILEESNQGRMPELIPIRYGRMLRSPFTFLRGSAAIMAHDLATTPNTGIHVQACGDCHLLNFGFFATPERNLVFDINDFDETHPAPWEWDIKRLVASFILAGRDNQITDKDSQSIAAACVRSYREHLRAYSRMSPLEVWYKRIDVKELIAMSPNEKIKKYRENLAERARKRVIEYLFPKIVTIKNGKHQFVDQPPILFHVPDEDIQQRVMSGLETYRQTLSEERRVLFDRYQLEDYAMKVVGIGSVGTHCSIALLFSEENHPLILQVKEARRSVLEPYTQPCRYENQGQRVVVGQRLMQSSSDIFLGWARSERGRDYYVRQLRDMKLSLPITGIAADQLYRYAEFCGWSLARSHAKAGDAATISGYLGKGDSFDQALAKFALAYADQTEKDYDALVQAVTSGRIEAIVEEDL